MSFEAINAVLLADGGLSAVEKAVLFGLANHASPQGDSIRPGIARLVGYTHLSERAVHRAIKALKERGILKVVGKRTPHGLEEYQMDLEALTDMAHPELTVRQVAKGHAISRGDTRSARPAPEPSDLTHSPPDLTHSPRNHHEPSIEPSGEPSKTPRAKARDPIFDAIAEVCQVDPATAGPSIGKVKAVLGKASPPYTPEEIHAFGVWWWAGGFRKRPPRIWDLQEQIGIVRNGGAPRPEPKGMAAIRAYEEEQRGRQ